MRTLNALSAIYLASASVFGVAIALQRNPDWTAQAFRAAQTVEPLIRHGADVANREAVRPALARIVAADKALFDAIDPPKPAAVAAARPVAKTPRKAASPIVVAHQAPPAPLVSEAVAAPALRPSIVEKAVPRVAKAVEAGPAMTVTPPQAPAANAPLPDLAAPGPAELARVMQRLTDSLTGEMLANFELFLYVSKAEQGPWAQHMYVFRKQASGDLDLLYDWPVSTGRELVEYAPNGTRQPSFTPQGYYELDPDRMYKHHVSGQWGTPMPYAMFFNWEQAGLQTGLAIHGATAEDIALLGHRASAGCVRLAPQNAALLFNLIRTDYRGLAPRFAFDRRTASMSNDGLLMHDERGHLQLAEGYKVLVFIENNGGNNIVAALY